MIKQRERLVLFFEISKLKNEIGMIFIIFLSNSSSSLITVPLLPLFAAYVINMQRATQFMHWKSVVSQQIQKVSNYIC